MRVNCLMVVPWKTIAVVCALIGIAGCGEPMEFRNAGSKHTLAADQQACDRELQTPAWAQYVKDAKGRLDPWQVCIERKGWKRVDRQAPPSGYIKS